MSYKTEFQANNADLQSLIDLANALPEATVQENLDAEMATQDDLIAQISAALVGKSGVQTPNTYNVASGKASIVNNYITISGLGFTPKGAMITNNGYSDVYGYYQTIFWDSDTETGWHTWVNTGNLIVTPVSWSSMSSLLVFGDGTVTWGNGQANFLGGNYYYVVWG